MPALRPILILTLLAALLGAPLVQQQPASAEPVRVAEFLADCPYSHRLPDDPIVFPGLPGASHMLNCVATFG